jgi:hypothetical protein
LTSALADPGFQKVVMVDSVAVTARGTSASGHTSSGQGRPSRQSGHGSGHPEDWH